MRPTSWFRIGLVALAALLASWQVVRTTAVEAFSERRPALAERFWSTHPQVVIQTALAEIGEAAAKGQGPDPATLGKVRRVLERDPLVGEPLLVEGTSALSKGEEGRAEALLREAVRRDPRSPAARYLLADLYLRQERAPEALRQIGALIRRLPQAVNPLVSGIARFAVQPGAAPQVRELLKQNPELGARVFDVLAQDHRNMRLILELAGPNVVHDPAPDWQVHLLAALLKAERYEDAHRLWARFSGVPVAASPTLFNPQFRPTSALPLFSWTLAKGSAGVADPSAEGGLHVLFYGREEAVLASQVLVLSPGDYRLRFAVRGDPQARESLAWAITCLGSNRLVQQQTIGSSEQLSFPISPACRAQELQLKALISEVPATREATLSQLALTRIGDR